MKHGQRSRISFGLVAALIAVFLAAPSGFAQAPSAAPPAPPAASPAPPAPTQTLSGAQLQKIDGWIKEKGRDIAVTPIITYILGLTKGDQTMSCRAFAAAGDGDEVHQIYALPDGKGYLAAHFYKGKIDVYWANKDFTLIAALEGVRDQVPAPMSFADAQYGFSFEVAWWAKYADAH